MVLAQATDRRIPALCALRDHDLHFHGTSAAPPPDCFTEGCDSATIVGLHEAARLAREAWEQLVCGCPSPGECCCGVEPHRLRFAHAARWAEDGVRERAGVWWRQTEQLLNDEGAAYCAFHPLHVVPCTDLCGEEEG